MTEEAEILLIEKGKYISYANCGLPYYIGGIIEERGKLFVQTPEAFGSVVLEQFGRKKLDLKLRNAYCELGVFDDKGKKVNLQNKPTKKPTL